MGTPTGYHHRMANRNQLWKELRDLRGVAIIGVVVAHSAIRILIARSGAGEMNSRSHLFLNGFWEVCHDLMSYSVPLFFFISGHFLGDVPSSWMAVWHRVRRLLYPYLFWSICYFFVTWIRGRGEVTVSGFLIELAQGRVSVYWFIFLLMQYYVLAKWLSPAVRRWPRRTLTLALLLQIGVSIWNYLVWHSLLAPQAGGQELSALYPMSIVTEFRVLRSCRHMGASKPGTIDGTFQ